MNGERYFLDTNILVYANDRSDAGKHAGAVRLVSEGLRTRRAVISSQVLSEFWVTVTRKARVPLSQEVAEAELSRLGSMKVVPVDYDTVVFAVAMQKRHGVSYWDALILAAAELSGCSVVYSEDLSHEQRYGDLVVRNPFAASGDAIAQAGGP